MNSIPFEQGPVISAFKAHSVAFERLGEADSHLAIDDELDDLGIFEDHLPCGSVGLLRDGIERGESLMGWSLLPGVILNRRIRLVCLNGRFREKQAGALACNPSALHGAWGNTRGRK